MNCDAISDRLYQDNGWKNLNKLCVYINIHTPELVFKSMFVRSWIKKNIKKKIQIIKKYLILLLNPV
jgi:hypothetical protein